MTKTALSKLLQLQDTAIVIIVLIREYWRYGVGVNNKKPMDMHDLYVWEPSAIKRTALRAAVEASTLILSINGVIALPKVRPSMLSFDLVI